MDVKLLLRDVEILEVLACVGLFVLIVRKGLLRANYPLAALLLVQAASRALTVPPLFFRSQFGIDRHVAVYMYFYTTWTAFFIQSGLFLFIVYRVYSSAMKPFDGLKRAGKIIFRWVAVVSVLFSLSLAIGPSMGKAHYIQFIAERIQQGLGVLTLCLLLFVCFAGRPLGLTYRSRIFGVSLGLGILATANFVEAAWYSASGPQSVYSAFYLVGALGWLASTLIWAFYFAVPEPEAKMVLLPTTSPFFLWNRVSEALGDAPGYVAVTGFRPDMLDPAELMVFTAASRMSRDRKARELAEQQSAAMAKVSLQSSGTFHSVAAPR